MSVGKGQRVDTDDLREFAKRVRGLLKDFEQGASGKKAHSKTGLSRTAFGSFGEAVALGSQYESMRDALRDVLNDLEAAVDAAQKQADDTADDFEGNDVDTATSFKREAAGSSSPPPVPKGVDKKWN